MSAVNEWIVREYFESLGFLVRQPRKYQVAARARMTPQEEVDLLVINPLPVEGPEPELGVWGEDQLRRIHRAVVGVRGWHTERFSPAVLKQAPEIYRFAEPDVVASIRAEVGEGPVTRILCLSELTASKSLQEESIEALRDGGISGVLLYPHLLRELIKGVDVNRNYEKSDLLQLLRILKNYNLIKPPQMELFEKRRRPRI